MDTLSHGLSHSRESLSGAMRLTVVVLSTVLALYLSILISERMMVPANVVKLDSLATAVPDGSPPLTVGRDGYGSYIGQRGADTAYISGDITDYVKGLTEPAILIQYSRRTIDMRVNGERLLPYSRPARLNGHIFQEPHLYLFPEELKPPYFLEMRAQTTKNQPYVGMPLLSEKRNLLRAYRWQYVVGVWMVTFSAAACMIGGLIAFLLSLRSKRPGEMVAFGCLMLGWMTVCLTYTGVFTGALGNIGNLIYTFAIFIVAVSALSFINEWTFRKRWIRYYAVPLMALLYLGLFIAMIFLDRSVFIDIILIADVIAAFAIVTMIWQVCSALLRELKISMFSAVVFLSTILAVVIDIISSVSLDATAAIWMGTPVTLHYGPIVCIFLGLTILSGFLRSFVETQRMLAKSNTFLVSQLAEREAEIANVYAQRETEMREAALVDERKRIMRDMHDGVGGKLLSLSLRAKGGRLAPSEMGKELDDSLQELRLIVDSMDTADGELDLALGALRGRLEPALYEAGIELDWDAGDLGHQPDYGPEEVLSIYRIIQEAVMNVIRHAKASEIHFESRILPNGTIEITIEDNGIGLSQDNLRLGAKGLSNLRARTKDLNGHIEFQAATSFESGLRVRLELPGKIGPGD